MEDYLQYEKSDDICCHGDVSQCFSRDHIKRYIGENDIGNYFVYCITLIAGYLAIDTAFEWILQNKKRELEQKKESEKKLYEILNNQIDVQNHIVDDLKQLQDRVDDIVLDRTVSALEPEEKGLSEEDHTKITKEINDYTIKTAKVIVKYVERGMQDLKKSIDALK